MRNLADIIEDVKTNGKPDYEELRYSVLVLTSMMNMASMTIRGLKPDTKEVFLNMKKDNIHRMYHTALNKSPKEYLGWNDDPENPEYQRFHAIGSKLVDKALKGELPNQKKQE